MQIALSVLFNVNFAETDSVLICSSPFAVLTEKFFSVVGCYTAEIGGTEKQIKKIDAQKYPRAEFVVSPLREYSGGYFQYVVLFDVAGDMPDAELNMYFAHLQPFGRLVVVDTEKRTSLAKLRAVLPGIKPDVEYDEDFLVFSGVRVTLTERAG